MATLNGNNVYLSWDGVQIDGYWTGDVSKDESVSTVDITAGSGATHVERASGLLDNSMSFSIVYDDADLATYVGKLESGTKATLIFGPEGNTAGKPKFECVMILSSVTGPSPSVAKGMVMFELSFEGAAAPTASIANGDTF